MYISTCACFRKSCKNNLFFQKKAGERKKAELVDIEPVEHVKEME